MPLEPERPGSIPALMRQGFRRFRKAFWVADAFLEAHVTETGHYGPWLTLHDPAGEAALARIGRAQNPPRLLMADPSTGTYETDWIGIR